MTIVDALSYAKTEFGAEAFAIGSGEHRATSRSKESHKHFIDPNPKPAEAFFVLGLVCRQVEF